MMSMVTSLTTFLSQAFHGLYSGLVSLPLAALVYGAHWALILYPLKFLVRRVGAIPANRAVQDFLLDHMITWRLFVKYALIDSTIGTRLEPLTVPLRTEPDATEVAVFFQVVVLLWVVEEWEPLSRCIEWIFSKELLVLGYLRMWGWLETPLCIVPLDGSPESYTLNARGHVAMEEDPAIRALVMSTNILEHIVAEAREVLMASLSWTIYVRWPEQLWTWAVRMLGMNVARPTDTSVLGRASMPLLSLVFAIFRTHIVGDQDDFQWYLFSGFVMLFESHFNPLFAPYVGMAFGPFGH